MLAMLILLFGSLMTTMMANKPMEHIQFSERIGMPIAESLLYYQNMATTFCLDKNTGKITCSTGMVPLRNRTGASNSMAYGTAFISSTDGSTYVMTTLGAANIGSLNLDKAKNAWLMNYLNNQTEHSVTIGYYNANTRRVELPNLQMTTNYPNYATPAFLKAPFDGEPVIFMNLK